MPTQYFEHHLPNMGFLQTKFSDQELLPLFEEIKKIEISNFKNTSKYNKALAGNLEFEFELFESKPYIESLIAPFCDEYNKQFGYTDRLGILSENVPLVLDSLWVNFQKKHEFNPVHNHQGLYSFVLWIDVPYDIADEIASPSSRSSNSQFPAHFQFLFTNVVGEISSHTIPVDRSYVNNMILFPSAFRHTVYPFSTSDSFRISVAGNYKLRIPNERK
jgi:hypothetical protein